MVSDPLHMLLLNCLKNALSGTFFKLVNNENK